MDTDDTVPDTTNVDLDEMRQLRVKVSVRTLVHLQYFRLTQAKGISEVVNDALNAYFEGLDVPGAKPTGAPRLPSAVEISHHEARSAPSAPRGLGAPDATSGAGSAAPSGTSP